MRLHAWLGLVFLILAAPSAGQMTPMGGELTVAQSSGVVHRPTSTIEFAAGLARANNSIMGLSRDGLGTITALSVSSQVHLILDVNGYFE